MSDYPTPNVSHDLSGQVALVTGTTSGLGRRFAMVLAACGAKVAVTGRRAERLEELAKDIRDAGGVCEPIPFDITDYGQIPGVVDKAETALGTVNILINNAGIPDARRAHKMSDDLVDSVFGTNLVGPWKLSCEVARRLIAAEKPGRMINISSVGGFRYDGNGAALYSVTKSAIVRMTEVLAVEWSRFHINVNAIAPGAFHSEMMDGMVSRMGDFSGNFPRGRICDPEQMDSTLLYFLSPASEAVTGTYVKIDDGQGAR
ncbi:MAG: SDR family NAD(P)-dependent oxidoreductase [Pseudomonadales bacterium]|nr:SDR family NAD(P)-dependent oxidoreductase [Pseudomonadales bacterium]MBO6595433.1 SDR family NAD(P)-dependent oxidoreductase [Pseudomonadales bacterium]MBO6821008.1 SDR family NAD(P)-dependent oxidoreductase [Pseudomonadales bacterium]